MRRAASSYALLSLAVLAAAAAAAAGRSAQALGLDEVVRGLQQPVFVTAPVTEPGRLYVVEQAGRIVVVERGAVRRTFLDIRSRVRAGGEQGLLGLAFHPSYAKNGLVYVNYTDTSGATRVVELRARSGRANAATARVLLTVPQPYSNHNGGMVAFGPDGRLYVGMGDGGSGGDPENRAQDMGSLLGKLLRLDVGRRGAKPEIVANGLRNPWRFSFDRATGDLWIGDVGQGEVEEVDRVRAGWKGLLNFGWDVYEGRSPFEDKPLGPGRLVQPVAQYTHGDGCSVTGGYVVRSAASPAGRGRYFYGDYCSGTIWSLRVSGGTVSASRREPFRVEGLVSFGEDAAGTLHLVAHDGTVYRLR